MPIKNMTNEPQWFFLWENIEYPIKVEGWGGWGFKTWHVTFILQKVFSNSVFEILRLMLVWWKKVYGSCRELLSLDESTNKY